MNGADLNDPLRNASGRIAPPAGLRLKALAAATALALAGLPNPSSGQNIGALDVRSRLGEPFFAAAPVTVPGGIIDPNCIRVRPNPNAPADALALKGVRIRVGSADTVIIETVGAVTGPVVGLRLEVGCSQPVTRDFLVVAPRVAQPQPAATVALSAPETADAQAVGERAAISASSVARSRSAFARTSGRTPASSQPTPISTASGNARPDRAAAASAPPRAARPATSRARAADDAGAAVSARTSLAAAPTATSSDSKTVPGAAARRDPSGRIAELQARSRALAEAVRSAEERVALLQKQAALLKTQLERRLAAPAEELAAQPAAQPEGRAAAQSEAQANAPASDLVVAPPAGQPGAQPANPVTAHSAVAETQAATEAEAPPGDAPEVTTPSEPAAAGSEAPAATPPSTHTAPAAVPAPVTAPVSAAQPPAASASSTVSKPSSRNAAQPQSVLDLLLEWKVAGGLAALALGALAFDRRRRRKIEPDSAATSDPAATAPAEPTPPRQSTQELPLAPADAPATNEWEIPSPRPQEQTDEWLVATPANAAPKTSNPAPTPENTEPVTADSAPVAASLAPVATTSAPTRGLGDRALASLPGAAMTREFHITQRFQPSAERVVALSSPEEIVQQARTHYMEDNDVFKAIDLLEMTISARNDSTRPWQALFAIYRRENMAERYQRLAFAYRDAFGEDESWPAICALGRQLAPNLLGGDESGDPGIADDLVERWLGVPLDFTAHLLANELHAQLMETYPGSRRRQRRTGP
jgi:hypothetical protein